MDLSRRAHSERSGSSKLGLAVAGWVKREKAPSYGRKACRGTHCSSHAMGQWLGVGWVIWRSRGGRVRWGEVGVPVAPEVQRVYERRSMRPRLGRREVLAERRSNGCLDNRRQPALIIPHAARIILDTVHVGGLGIRVCHGHALSTRWRHGDSCQPHRQWAANFFVWHDGRRSSR